MNSTWNILPVEFSNESNYNETKESNLEKEAAKCAEIEKQLLEYIRQSCEPETAIKEAISIILYVLEHPQSYRQQYLDLPAE